MNFLVAIRACPGFCVFESNELMCHHSEGVNGRALGTGVSVSGGQATVALCVAACKEKGFSMAGIEYANECCKFIDRAK